MNTDELLIESVREYPFLYDVSDPGYHDNRKKDNAWQRISEKFDSSTGKNMYIIITSTKSIDFTIFESYHIFLWTYLRELLKNFEIVNS